MGLLAILLTVVFVTLKVTHIIAWSWLLVVSPLLIFVALAIIFFIVGAIIFGAFVRGLTR